MLVTGVVGANGAQSVCLCERVARPYTWPTTGLSGICNLCDQFDYVSLVKRVILFVRADFTC